MRFMLSTNYKIGSVHFRKENISADVYNDDFFGAETPELADMVFCRFKELFKELHLEAAIDKDVPPTYKLLCLGVMVDALELTSSVPEFRIAELTEELERWKKLCLLSKRDVQRLLGKLSYVAACVPPGRPFLASLINALSSFETCSSKMEISSDIRDNLQWWRLFLRKYNGISIFPGQSIIDSVELFSTDACRSGPRVVVVPFCLMSSFIPNFQTL